MPSIIATPLHDVETDEQTFTTYIVALGATPLRPPMSMLRSPELTIPARSFSYLRSMRT